MAHELVSDELWSRVRPLLPRTRRSRRGGRPRVDDRAVFAGIVFVLRTGSPWRLVPRELNCGSGVLASAARLAATRRVEEDPSRDARRTEHAWRTGPVGGGDRLGVGACGFGGPHTGPNCTDRGKRGCKRHVISDACGVPLVVRVTGANVYDSLALLPLVDALPRVRRRRGARRRYKPRELLGDRAYGARALMTGLRRRGIRPLLSPRKQSRGSGLGKRRYVIERTLAWFNFHRRLRVCYERTGESFAAFHDLAAALICFGRLRQNARARGF